MAIAPVVPFVLFAIALAGCTEPEPVERFGASRVRFEPGHDFATVPFPSDLYRDEAGAIVLGAVPNPLADGAMMTALRELLSQRDGFCTTCNVTFAIEGGLDVDALQPSAAPGDEASLEDPVALVDVDPGSPEYGRVVPLRVQWDADRGLLSARPVRGVTLRGGGRYAAIVTPSLVGADGLAVGPAPAFVTVRDRAGGDDDQLAAAARVLGPALEALDDLGVPARRVVGLAAFTTETPGRDLEAIRAAVREAPAPVAEVDRIWAGDDLDGLLGVPAEDRPGVDVPPAEGQQGTAAIAHVTVGVAVAGRFRAPRFVEGEGADIGATTRDAGASPVALGTDEVPFLLIVPSAADVTRLPVVVSHHGFNSSRVIGFALADTAGRAGFAVLSIDAFQHGARAATATDAQNSMRGGLEGPDGFSEASSLDVTARSFGISGVPSDMTLYPGFPLAAFEQFAADAMSAVRLAVEGDLTAVRAAHPTLAGLAFDPERVAFVGNSMGAVVGTSVVVAEPDVRAAVLNVMPGSIVETLCESGEFRPLIELLVLPIIGVDDRFDERQRSCVFDVTVDLVRWALEPIDPLALSRHLVRERLGGGGAPDLLVQLAGHDEVAAPTASESVIGAAGVPGDGEFAYAVVDRVEAPVSANLAGATVAAMRFDGAMHGMLEVAVQRSRLEDPLEPPLQERDEPIDVVNPVVDVHAQIEAFLRSFSEEGRATIDR